MDDHCHSYAERPVVPQHLPEPCAPSGDPAADMSEVVRRHPCGAVIPLQVQRSILALCRSTRIPVLIRGESGTGKGVVADLIAQQRARAPGFGRFISLNCATLNSDVADAVVFGRKRGAYTGAFDDTIGAVGEADGGILFLDEIHCLSVESQRKLLRLLDHGTYSRVGETTERVSRFQLLTATNQDLQQLVLADCFIFDLLMRIQGIELFMPPLRERSGDLRDLIALYLHKHEVRIGMQDLDRLTRLCSGLYWPGNIRQLHRALDVAVFTSTVDRNSRLADCFVATAAMQAFDAPGAMPAEVPASLASRRLAVTAGGEAADPVLAEAIQEIAQIERGQVDLACLMTGIERRLLEYTLRQHSRISDVMAHLKLSRGQLDFKRRKFGLMGS